MCGEMAGDPRYTALLLGLGLREFSMQPGSLLEVKDRVRASDIGGLTRATQSLMESLDELEPAELSERLTALAAH
jgi:phosphotransferase system enzyme I (PtsI)